MKVGVAPVASYYENLDETGTAMKSIKIRAKGAAATAAMITALALGPATGALAQDYTNTPPPPTPTPEVEVLGVRTERAQVGGLPVTGADIIQLGALGAWTVAFGGALTRLSRRAR